MTFQKTAFDTITVNVNENSAVQFAYTDSGAPLTGDRCYTTIIAIHGMCFTAPVFKRVQALAQGRGIRFVALNRRNYPGSTPYSVEETNVLLNGTKEERDVYLRNRGHEIALFIDKFIEKTDIAPTSTTTGGGGVKGGIALVTWSAGSGLLNATIAHADTLPRPVQSRLSSYIRSLFFQEPHGTLFGFSVPECEYSPTRLVDHIPSLEDRHKMFGQWVSGYYEHGDVSTQDRKALSWIVPSTKRIGTLYNISEEEQEEMLCLGYEASLDPLFMRSFGTQLGEAYRKTFFPSDEPRLFKDLKITYFVGGMGPAFAFDAVWNLEKDVKEAGSKGRRVDVKIVPGTNHFTHWDDPEMALDMYLESA